MSFHSWLRELKKSLGQPATPTRRPRPWKLSPRTGIERLEDRITPHGETIATATLVTVAAGGESVQSGVMGDGSYGMNDVDLWEVHVRAGQTITADIDARFNDDGTANTSNTLDAYLRLFNASGTELKDDDDSGDGLDPQLSYTVSTTAYYYVGVTAYSNTAYNPNTAGSGSGGNSEGSYRLELRKSNSAPTADATGPTGARTDGDGNQVFSWSASDLDGNLSSVSARIVRNGVNLRTSAATSSSLTVTPSDGPGTYHLAVTATDSLGLSGSDTTSPALTITDDDTAGPTITLSGSSGSQTDGQSQSFTWSASDPSGLSAVAVGVTRNGVSIFTGSSAASSFNFDAQGLGTYVITVTATDNDSDRPGDQSSSSATRTVTVTDDDVAAPAITLGGSSGTETRSATQAFTWGVTDASGVGPVTVSVTKDGVAYHSTTGASGAYNFDAAGLGTYVLTVTATDADADRTGDALTGTSTRSVVVANAPPVAAFTSQTGRAEGEPIGFDGRDSSDPDGDALSYSWDFGDGTTGSGPTPTHTYVEDGSYTVSLSVSDGYGGTAAMSGLSTVANAAPVGTLSNDGPASEGGSATVSLTGASDPSASDTAAGFRYSFATSTSGLAAVYSLAGATASQAFPFAEDGSYTVYGRVFDRDGGSNTFSTAVAVANVAPTATLSNGGPVPEDAQVTLTFTAQSDPSALDTAAGFRYSFATTPGGLAAAYAAAGSAPSGQLLLTVGGTYPVYGRVFDRDGGFTDHATTVTAFPTNDAPAGTDGAATTPEDTAHTFAPADFGFTDPSDVPADGFLSVTIVALPAVGTLALAGVAVTAGQVVPAADIAAGLLRYTPAQDANGMGYASFTFRVQDSGGTVGGGEDLDPTPNTLTLNVSPVNDAPVAAGEAYLTAEDTPLAVAAPGVLGNDADVDGDALNAVLLAAPLHGTVSLDPSGSFTYTPAPDYHGPDSFTYRVWDGTLGSDPVTVGLTVTPVNDAPSAAATGTPAIDEGGDFVGSGAFADPDSGDAWAATVDYGDGTTPEALTLAADRTFQLAHRYADDGLYTVTVVVTDAAGAAGTATRSLAVANAAPVIASVAPTGPTNSGVPFTLAVAATDAGGANDPLAYEFDFDNDGVYEVSGLAAEAAHTYAAPGYYPVSVRVSDGDGGVATATLTLAVDPPVAFELADQSVSEGDGGVTVTARLGYALATDVTVPFTLSGTAGAADYVIAEAAVVIPAGQLTGSVVVQLADDDLYELTETVTLTMGQPDRARPVGVTAHTVRVGNNDPIPQVGFTLHSQAAAEGDGPLTLTLQLSNPSVLPVTVPLAFFGSAALGSDYTVEGAAVVNGVRQVVIPAGARTAQFAVRVTDDIFGERTEGALVTIGTPTNATRSSDQSRPNSQHLTLRDNEPAQVVSFVTTGERVEEAALIRTVQVRLSGPVDEDIVVPFRFGGTAARLTDYTVVDTATVDPPTAASRGLAYLRIARGATSGSILLQVIDDTLWEGKAGETIELTLQRPYTAQSSAYRDSLQVGTNTYALQVTDEDLPTVTFTTDRQSVSESAGTASFVARLSNLSEEPVVVDLAFSGSAKLGTDYTPRVVAGGSVRLLNGKYQLVIPALTRTATVTVQLTNDSDEEVYETIRVQADAVEGARFETKLVTTSVRRSGRWVTVQVPVADRPDHTITVENDDAPKASFWSSSSSVGEGGGSRSITVKLSNPVNRDVRIPITYSGAAKRREDFTAPTSVTIPEGETSARFSVALIDDAVDEADEKVTVTLGTPDRGAATLLTKNSSHKHVLTINDNDAAPRVEFLFASSSDGEVTATQTVYVIKTGYTQQSVTVPISIYLPNGGPGRATLYSDYYTSSSQSVTFAPNEYVKSFALTTFDDGSQEGNEVIDLVIGWPTNATVGTNYSYRFTIRANDGPPPAAYDPSPTAITGTLPFGDFGPAGGGAYTVDDGTASVAANAASDPFGAVPFTVAVTTDGSAYDGYVAGATVFLDTNKDGVRNFLDLNADGLQADDEPNEPSAVTAADGSFRLDVSPVFDRNGNQQIDPNEGWLVMAGGVDISTRLPMTTPLIAPAGSSSVTPLTTLVSLLLEQGRNRLDPDGVALPDLTVAEATDRVRDAFGLPGVDLMRYDPLAATVAGDLNGPPVFAAIAKLQNLVAQGAALLGGVPGAPSPADLGRKFYQDLATKLGGGNFDLSSDDSVRATLTDVLIGTGLVLRDDPDPADDASPEADALAGAAQVIAAGNRAIDQVEPTATLAYLEQVARVQTVAEGYFAGRLAQVGAGLDAAQVVAEAAADNLAALVAAAQIGNLIPPTMTVNTLAAFEGATGAVTSYRFAVTLDRASRVPVTVGYKTSDYTATAGLDYTATAGTLTFAPGELTKTVTVLVHGDDAFEANETFLLSLENVVDAVLGIDTGVGIVGDDDPLTVAVPAGNALNELVLRLDGPDLVLTNNGTVIRRERAAISAPVTITGDPAAVNRLTVDLSNGNPLPGGGLTFTGGSATDRITVTGAAEAAVADAPTGPAAGVLTVNGSPIAYSGVEEVSRPAAVRPALPFVVGENGSLALPLAVDAFGGQDPAAFTYNWDLDGDGAFGEAGADATRGDESGATPTFSAAGIDGPATHAVAVRVIDGHGLASEASFVVTVANVAPTLTLAGPAAADEGAVYRLTLASSDPGADTLTGWTIAWGDGSSEDVAGGASGASHVYADGGVYTVTASATDEDGTHPSNALVVSVANVAPTATISNGGPAGEGSPVTVSLTSASDPSPADTAAGFRYSLALDSAALAGSYNAASPDGSAPFTFDDNGSYVVHGRVFDKDGGSSDYQTLVVVTNVAPVAAITGAPTSSPEGAAIALGSAVADPGLADTFAFTWSVTKGGAAYGAGGSGPAFHFTPDDDGDYAVTLTVADDDGDGHTVSETIRVTNVAPTVTLSGPAAADEGRTSRYTFTSSDPGADSFSVVASGGVVGVVGNLLFDRDTGAGSFDVTFTDNAARSAVSVRVADSDGDQSDTATIGVAVANVAPSPAIVRVGGVRLEGTAIEVEGAAADPAGASDTLTFAWSVTASNGQVVPAASGVGLTVFSFTPADNGEYTVTLAVSDEDGGTATVSQTVAVANAAPLHVNAGADQEAREGTPVSLSGSFTDSGSADTHAQVWSVVASNGQAIADGSDGAFTFTPDDNGTYTLTYTVTDDDGAVTSDTAVVTVTNAAPTPTIDSIGAIRREGTAIAVAGSATDPAGANDTATYAWAVYKDGSATAFAVGGDGTAFYFTPTDDGSYEIRLSVADEDGGAAAASRTIRVANVKPVAAITAPATGAEGAAVPLSAAVTDAGPVDQAAGFTYRWAVTRSRDGGSTWQNYATAATADYSLVPNDDGRYRVTLTAADKDGTASDAVFKDILVTNVAPTPGTVSIGGVRQEGTAIAVAGSATDPAGANDTLTFAWSVTGPNGFIRTGSGSSWSFTPTDDGSYRVALTVSDEDGGSASAEQTVAVANVAPTVTLSGAAAVNQGLTYTLTLSGLADPGADAAFGVVVAWGDGTSTALTAAQAAALRAGATAQVRHVYAAGGSYAVAATVADEDGAFGPSTSPAGGGSRPVAVSANPGATLEGGRLVVVGTAGDDDIKVNPGGGAPEIKLKMNGTQQTFLGVTEVVVYANAGNDSVQVVGGVRVPAVVLGGAGADTLQGGGGDDVLVGGDGDDLIVGGTGRDIIIGGRGADRLSGSEGDDILIAGYTAFDADLAALGAARAEWVFPRGFAERVANLDGTTLTGANGQVFLRATGPDATVFDDAEEDVVSGDAGSDWFLVNVTGGVKRDRIVDLSAFESEFVDDLELHGALVGP